MEKSDKKIYQILMLTEEDANTIEDDGSSREFTFFSFFLYIDLIYCDEILKGMQVEIKEYNHLKQKGGFLKFLNDTQDILFVGIEAVFDPKIGHAVAEQICLDYGKKIGKIFVCMSMGNIDNPDREHGPIRVKEMFCGLDEKYPELFIFTEYPSWEKDMKNHLEEYLESLSLSSLG